MSAVNIQNCTYTYDAEAASPAVSNVSLQIKKGEFISVIGHNGSGKSSLAKLINALYLPQKGEITVFDMKTSDAGCLWEIRRRAGMIFQNPDNQLVATMVEDDVAFGPENIGIPPAEIRKRVSEALKAVNMSGFSKRSTHMLSGGQKQRIAIAGVLALMPDIIIMDEPTAMLDPIGRKEVMDTALALNKDEGITIILITHYMEEAALADKIFVMDSGSLAMSGTPAEIFSRADELKNLGLTVPPVVEIACRLKEKGLDIATDTFDETELVNRICRLL